MTLLLTIKSCVPSTGKSSTQKLNAMIAEHMIQQITDLSVRLTGDELTPQEEQVLQNSSIEELQAIRENLLLALQF
jgi:hypothetical protein